MCSQGVFCRLATATLELLYRLGSRVAHLHGTLGFGGSVPQAAGVLFRPPAGMVSGRAPVDQNKWNIMRVGWAGRPFVDCRPTMSGPGLDAGGGGEQSPGGQTRLVINGNKWDAYVGI